MLVTSIFFFFPQCFPPLQKKKFNFCVIFILSSAIPFNLVQSTFLSWGKESNNIIVIPEGLIVPCLHDNLWRIEIACIKVGSSSGHITWKQSILKLASWSINYHSITCTHVDNIFYLEEGSTCTNIFNNILWLILQLYKFESKANSKQLNQIYQM